MTQRMKIPLPEYFLEWVDSIEGCYCVKHSDRFWFISSRSELLEEINVDHKITPSWQQLASFAAMFHDLTGKTDTDDHDGKPFSLERLSACIVIGDDNGDPLFTDPSDGYSVWCYYHDGGDVEILCNSLTIFIDEAEIIRG